MTKHYRNRRLDDPEFVLDFEEIYVIDSQTKSITRAKVLVRIFVVNISFKTVMANLLMLLVDVEWLFASLPLEF